jgi:SAM-dependent methyltransferase
MLPRRAHVLDAGCGQGRVAAYLHAAGHVLVGVDADSALVAAAAIENPGPRYLVADLSALDLSALADDVDPDGRPVVPFDAAVMAGNVMPYVAPGTEVDVLRRVRDHLVDDGFLVVGFGLSRGYALERFDHDAREAGFVLEHRFATWDLRPWRDDSDWAVTVLRRR